MDKRIVLPKLHALQAIEQDVPCELLLESRNTCARATPWAGRKYQMARQCFASRFSSKGSPTHPDRRLRRQNGDAVEPLER